MDPCNENFFLELSFACAETRQSFDTFTGISQSRRQLLALLAQKGELSHAALQQNLSLDGATVTRLVKEFEGNGWVSRRLDPQNNRFTLVALTEAGQKEIARLHASHHSFQARLLAGISPAEQETVINILGRLRANLRRFGETQEDNRNIER